MRQFWLHFELILGSILVNFKRCAHPRRHKSPFSALGSARVHLRHEHNSKGPSWGRGPMGGAFGPPFWEGALRAPILGEGILSGNS